MRYQDTRCITDSHWMMLWLWRQKMQKPCYRIHRPDWPVLRKTSSGDEEGHEKRKDIVFFIKIFPLPFIRVLMWSQRHRVCEKSMDLLEAAPRKTLPEPKCETKAIEETSSLQKTAESVPHDLIFPSGISSPVIRMPDALIGLIDKQPHNNTRCLM